MDGCARDCGRAESPLGFGTRFLEGKSLAHQLFGPQVDVEGDLVIDIACAEVPPENGEPKEAPHAWPEHWTRQAGRGRAVRIPETVSA